MELPMLPTPCFRPVTVNDFRFVPGGYCFGHKDCQERWAIELSGIVDPPKRATAKSRKRVCKCI